MRQATKKGTVGFKRCAFCKYFYDPANSVIAPRRGAKDWWEYDKDAVKYCTMRMADRRAQATCRDFESKI